VAIQGRNGVIVDLD